LTYSVFGGTLNLTQRSMCLRLCASRTTE